MTATATPGDWTTDPLVRANLRELHRRCAAGQSVVLVDELAHPATAAIDAIAAASYLTVAGNLDALHLFARRIGLRCEWFQSQDWPHYDLTPNKRERAMQYGALFVPAKAQACLRVALVPLAALMQLGRGS